MHKVLPQVCRTDVKPSFAPRYFLSEDNSDRVSATVLNKRV